MAISFLRQFNSLAPPLLIIGEGQDIHAGEGAAAFTHDDSIAFDAQHDDQLHIIIILKVNISTISANFCAVSTEPASVTTLLPTPHAAASFKLFGILSPASQKARRANTARYYHDSR